MNKEPFEVESFRVENKEEFIKENKRIVYLCACKICNRKLDWNNDDELSVALIAFNNAIDTYNNERGNFYNYAKVVIRNSLIDYFRNLKRNSYLIFKDEEILLSMDKKEAISQFEKEKENKILAEEIAALSDELDIYKIKINDLLKSSPSHIDTRNALLKIAFKSSSDEGIVQYINIKRNLPIKQIMLLSNSKRKYIEKWRKYILVLIVILSSREYQYIKSFLNIKVGEYNE